MTSKARVRRRAHLQGRWHYYIPADAIDSFRTTMSPHDRAHVASLLGRDAEQLAAHLGIESRSSKEHSGQAQAVIDQISRVEMAKDAGFLMFKITGFRE